ncbi:hypothetical protein TNCV_2452951 [Trichonephila clavipes]|nr:hypothetical protein TNCV_2452951 [Trichonephila clavipes]
MATGSSLTQNPSRSQRMEGKCCDLHGGNLAAAMLIKCSQLASLDKNNNALREIKLRSSYLQGKSTTMSVIAHQTEKEWISANEKSRQRMSQTQAEGAADQYAARLEDAHHSCFTTSERC